MYVNSHLAVMKRQLADLWAIAALNNSDSSATMESVHALIAEAFDVMSDLEGAMTSISNAQYHLDNGQTRLALFHIKEALDTYNNACYSPVKRVQDQP